MRGGRAWEAKRFVLAVVRAFERIETERLVLRWLTPADAVPLAATIDAVVIENNGWTDAHVRMILAEIAAGRRHRLRRVARAAMTDRAAGVVVGCMLAGRVDARERSCELGWWTGPADRGRGYATEAAGAVVAALHAAGVCRIWIGTAPENTAVQRTAVETGARLIRGGPHQLPNGIVIRSLWYAHDG